MKIEREWLEELIFGTEASRRFTQDSPVLPDVWIKYGVMLGEGRDAALDCLLTPHSAYTAGALQKAVRERLAAERAEGGRSWVLRQASARRRQAGDTPVKPPPVSAAYNQSSVVVGLFFDELLTVALPLTSWWREYVCRYPGRSTYLDLRQPDTWTSVATDMRRAIVGAPVAREQVDLLWLITVVGSILEAAEEPQPDTPEAARARWKAIVRDGERLVERFHQFVLEPTRDDHSCDLAGSRHPPCLFMLSENRPAQPTLTFSVRAVKGDAAQRVFEASCRGVAWAILDSGVDALHPAFRLRQDDGKPYPQAFEKDTAGNWVNRTRVVETYDFTRIRHLLSGNPEMAQTEVERITQEITQTETHAREVREVARTAAREDRAHLKAKAAQHVAAVKALRRERRLWEKLAASSDEESAKDLRNALQSGRAIDWGKVEPFIRIPHESPGTGGYRPPRHEHGTHVAGILAADWRSGEWGAGTPQFTAETLRGMCPDIRLYDFRVFSDDGSGDEFSVIAALQFLRHLNSQRDVPPIQGANLSLAIRHDVANYACGRTPVCDECERLVNSGVVVVAAAGNYGFNRFATLSPAGAPTTYEGYSAISITDPGNAESVITVGSTHRIEPHTYGVSYFSSRGPTGDGRYKPDLVAPGEKIKAPVPGNGVKVKDGTSMAAPHVSGAAALIMARYTEFVGQPARVKEVLCRSATDLGRDRYFQGAGMLDILRALQSV